MTPPVAAANPSQIHPAERLIAVLGWVILCVIRRHPLLRFMPPLRWMLERELRRMQQRLAELAATPIPPRPIPPRPMPEALIAPLAPVALSVASTRPAAPASSRSGGRPRQAWTGARAIRSVPRPAAPERARRTHAPHGPIVSPPPASTRGRIAPPPAAFPPRKNALRPALSMHAHFVTIPQ